MRGRIAVIWLVAAACIVAGAVGAWALWSSPGVAFLPPGPGAAWILYPHVPRVSTRPAVELETCFRRSFVAQEATSATVELVAYRKARLEINGEAVPLPRHASWKRKRVALHPGIRPGLNTIMACVINGRGPPALWLRLRGGGVRLATDRTWQASLEGAPWEGARLAGAQLRADALDPELRPIALPRRTGFWAVLLTGALAAPFGWVVLRARRRKRRDKARAVTGLALGMAFLWCILVLNNAARLTWADGYDAEGHLEYIAYIWEHGALPPADAGWSTFQPPLYYLCAAALLKLLRLNPLDREGVAALHALGGLVGLVEFGFLYGALRRIFRGRYLAQAGALLVAVSLPVRLYMHQAIGNDGLAAALAAGALFVFAGWRKKATVDWRMPVLGVLLGAALLAKMTALPVVALVVTVASLHALRCESWRERLAGIALLAGGVALVAGWWMAGRVAEYGSPLAGNWDPRIAPPWWQDRGYVPLGYYWPSLDVLRMPWFASLNGFWEGFYATLWGDALLSGRSTLSLAPPWNHEAMAAGYVLAVVPTGLMLLGFGASLRSGTGFADRKWLLGLTLLSLLGLAAWPLRVPIYSVVKAAFIMPATLALACWAGIGLVWIRQRKPLLLIPALALLGAWTANAYGSFWIARSKAAPLARMAWIDAHGGFAERAEREARAALRRDPNNARALATLARISSARGQTSEAQKLLLHALEAHPSDTTANLEMARLCERQGRAEEVVFYARRVLAQWPSHAAARVLLARALRAMGRHQAALQHALEALRVAPELSEIHELAASLYDLVGEAGRARWHRREARRLGTARESAGIPQSGRWDTRKNFTGPPGGSMGFPFSLIW